MLPFRFKLSWQHFLIYFRHEICNLCPAPAKGRFIANTRHRRRRELHGMVPNWGESLPAWNRHRRKLARRHSNYHQWRCVMRMIKEYSHDSIRSLLGEIKGFLKTDGTFVISKVPSGSSYVVEILNPNYLYEPVRVEINNKGKFRARKVNVSRVLVQEAPDGSRLNWCPSIRKFSLAGGGQYKSWSWDVWDVDMKDRSRHLVGGGHREFSLNEIL